MNSLANASSADTGGGEEGQVVVVEEEEERLEVVEESEDGGDEKGWEVLSGCGGLTDRVPLVCGGVTVGLGDKIGGLTTLLKFEEEEEEVQDVVVEEEEGKCEALFTASHIDTPPGPPPNCLEVVVKEVVEEP